MVAAFLLGAIARAMPDAPDAAAPALWPRADAALTRGETRVLYLPSD